MMMIIRSSLCGPPQGTGFKYVEQDFEFFAFSNWMVDTHLPGRGSNAHAAGRLLPMLGAAVEVEQRGGRH